MKINVSITILIILIKMVRETFKLFYQIITYIPTGRYFYRYSQHPQGLKQISCQRSLLCLVFTSVNNERQANTVLCALRI